MKQVVDGTRPESVIGSLVARLTEAAEWPVNQTEESDSLSLSISSCLVHRSTDRLAEADAPRLSAGRGGVTFSRAPEMQTKIS